MKSSVFLWMIQIARENSTIRFEPDWLGPDLIKGIEMDVGDNWKNENNEKKMIKTKEISLYFREYSDRNISCNLSNVWGK